MSNGDGDEFLDSRPLRRISGEHAAVQLVEVPTPAPKRADWIKIAAALGGVIALTQALNTLGPCNLAWRFQTTEEATAIRSENDKAHARIELDVATTKAVLGRVEKKLDGIESQQEEVLRRLPKRGSR
jgi:hypothetical protein